MQRRDVQALHTKTTEELTKLLKETQDKRREAALELSQMKAKNTRNLYMTRKEIAQILTVIKEKSTEVTGTSEDVEQKEKSTK